MLDALGGGLLAVDGQGVVVWANSAAGELLGAGPDGLEGMAAQELGALLGALAGQCLESRQSARGRLASGPSGAMELAAFPMAGQDGAAGVVVTLAPAAQSSGEGLGAQGLPGLTRSFSTVFNCVSDGIWICDGSGTILGINSASQRLNSIRAADFVGKNVSCIVKEGLVDRSVTLDVLRTQHQASLIQYIKKTGKQLLVTGTPAFDDAGGLSMVVVNERDITELNTLRTGLENARQVQEGYRRELAELSMLELGIKDVVAESPQMRQVVNSMIKLACMNASQILILGESGTGKGLLAKFLHKQSPRAEKPFIQINCPALPESLFEAELFGYEKGAFTGAREQGKVGLIELAQGGTLFLDEIGDIPMAVQAKLLKYLDDHEFLRLGGNTPRRVECAVVAATNQDLDRLIAKRHFRQDLFYRLNTFTVGIPPLRERREDIFGLINHYLAHFNEKFGVKKRLSLKAVRLLESHDYPGNVRELVGILQKAFVMSEGDDLTGAIEEALSGRMDGSRPKRPQSPRTLDEEVDEAVSAALGKAFAICRTTREMARYLGVSQATIVRKMQRYGLSPDDSHLNQK